MMPHERIMELGEALDDARERIAELEAEIREKDERMELLEQFGEAAWKEIAFLGKPNIMLYNWLSGQAGELGLR